MSETLKAPKLSVTELIFHTYIVTNFRMGTLYTGHTDDLGERMEQHMRGQFEGFTKTHGCKHLVWCEAHESREDAFLRERRIKKWNREWKIGLIEQDNAHWLDIYQCPVWPVPDQALYPDLHAQCLATALPRRISGLPPSRG